MSESFKPIFDTFSELMKREDKILNILEFFEGNDEYLMAVQYQNLMHPQNKHRTAAIKDGTYVFIDSKETAAKFMVD